MNARTSTPSEPLLPLPDTPPSGSRLERLVPHAWRPYLRLARIDRPIGTWLLLFPCLWAVSLAGVSDHAAVPDVKLLILFTIGAFLMRGSGCAYNDYCDRDLDAKVARTANRPIPSGQVSPKNALIFSAALAGLAFFVLIQFNWYTIWLGMASLAVVAVYPFMKRLTYLAQVVLGLAFNWGALVGWAAVKGSLDWPALLLFLGSVAWTVGYDTIYALQDRTDDERLGLKSTALLFGADQHSHIGMLYGTAVILWLAAGFAAGAHLIYFTAVVLVSLQLAWQVSTLLPDDVANCLRRFRSNRDVGIALFLGLVADMSLSWFAGLN